MGHRVIAEIAYAQLTPKTKHQLLNFNRAVNRVYGRMNFIEAAVWLDTMRANKGYFWGAYHYIDIPFSDDGSALPPIARVNAVSALDRALMTLHHSNSSPFEKGVALRVILHVVGDIHQPMHAIARITRNHPEGDKGGQYVHLFKNHVARNLHSYWDNGGGYLQCKKNNPHCKRDAKKLARELLQEFSCDAIDASKTPMQWAIESFELGKEAYRSLEHNAFAWRYQMDTVRVAKKRLLLAGCRLGKILS